jgi:predicted CXXCH cytochrome family protein
MIQLVLLEILINLMAVYPGTHSPGSPDQRLQNGPCTECHRNMVEHTVMHYPAGDACDYCHESTGSSHPQAGVAGFALVDRMPDLCFNCHEPPAAHAFIHPPVEQGDCLDCHDPHGSSEKALLRLEEQELCLSCHDKDYRTDSSETENIRSLVRGKSVAHTAITESGCMICHKAHGSEFRKLLVAPYPGEDYVFADTKQFELCFLCHDGDLINAEQTGWATGFRDGERNLHRVHINGPKGRNCNLCHDIHGSPQKFLVRERVVFGDWEMNMNFNPEEQGGSCLPGCHGRLTYGR